MTGDIHLVVSFLIAMLLYYVVFVIFEIFYVSWQ